MDEKIYLQEGGVLVSSARLQINGQTFAMRNVGSVRMEDEGRPWLAIFIGLAGASFGAGGNVPVAVLLVGLAGYLGWRKMAARKLVLVAGGGESVALRSTDGAFVAKVNQAVAQALSQR